MALRKFVANKGKVWKVKATGDILSNELYLGINDFIGNYEQVDEPKEENPLQEEEPNDGLNETV